MGREIHITDSAGVCWRVRQSAGLKTAFVQNLRLSRRVHHM